MQTQNKLYEQLFPDTEFPYLDKKNNPILSPSGKSLLFTNIRELWAGGDLLLLRAGRRYCMEVTFILLSGSLCIHVPYLYFSLTNVDYYPDA